MPIDLSLGVINNLKMSYRPIPQSYSAYTQALDNLNAGFYRSEKAPEFVIFVASGLVAIDGKHAFWDESETKRALLERYSYVGEWSMILDFWGTGVYNGPEKILVLKKRGHSDPPRTLWSDGRTTTFNQKNEIQPLNHFAYLYAEVGYSPIGKLESLLHQPPALQMVLEYDDGTSGEFRVSPSILKTGILISHKSDQYLDIQNIFNGKISDNKRVRSFSLRSPMASLFNDKITFRIEERIFPLDAGN